MVRVHFLVISVKQILWNAKFWLGSVPMFICETFTSLKYVNVILFSYKSSHCSYASCIADNPHCITYTEIVECDTWCTVQYCELTGHNYKVKAFSMSCWIYNKACCVFISVQHYNHWPQWKIRLISCDSLSCRYHKLTLCVPPPPLFLLPPLFLPHYTLPSP